LVHVTVIDGTGAKPRRGQTVLITGDRIAAVGSDAGMRLPAGTRTIDGAGRFLIPGLWDMHVHAGSRSYLPLFIASGVTGIRLMDGASEYHRWREEVEAGAVAGPRMVIASAIMDGPKTYFSDHVVLSNAEEARAAVRKARQEGAEFIKVHDQVPREAYFALIDEARRQRLPVAGHVPLSITPSEASDAGQVTIEHLTQLDDLSFAGSGPKSAADLFARFRKNHTWQCPTLVMTRGYTLLDDPAVTDDPRLKYVRRSQRDAWSRMKAAGLSLQEATARKGIYRKRQAIVGRMQRAGVGLLAGTDLGNPFLAPGFSLHDELALLVESGLTPMEALQAATRNPARLLGRENDLGTLEKGKLADLVLLDGNPLIDIHNTTKIRAVVARGELYERAALDRLLASAETAAEAGN